MKFWEEALLCCEECFFVYQGAMLQHIIVHNFLWFFCTNINKNTSKIYIDRVIILEENC